MAVIQFTTAPFEPNRTHKGQGKPYSCNTCPCTIWSMLVLKTLELSVRFYVLLRFPWAKDYEQVNYSCFVMDDCATFKELIKV